MLKILEKKWDESLLKYIFAVASQNRKLQGNQMVQFPS